LKTYEILDQYMLEICVKYGFCLPRSAVKELISNPGNSASIFVKKIILAEGLGQEGIELHFDSLYSLLLELCPKVGDALIRRHVYGECQIFCVWTCHGASEQSNSYTPFGEPLGHNAVANRSCRMPPD